MSSNIAIYQPDLNAKSLEIYKKLDSRLVADVPEAQLFEIVRSAASVAYANAGYKIPEAREFTYQIKEVVEFLKKFLPAIREEEIVLAFRKGVVRDYGDYMGLSVVSFVHFLNSYMKDKDRMEALAERNKPRSVPQPPNYNQRFDTAKGNALNALKAVSEGREIGLSAGVVYDFLDQIGILNYTTEEKKEMYEEARQFIMEDYTGRVELDRQKRLDNKSIMEALLGGMDSQDRVKHMIKTRAKGIALRAYLESVLFDEIDLDGLMEERRKEGEE